MIWFWVSVVIAIVLYAVLLWQQWIIRRYGAMTAELMTTNAELHEINGDLLRSLADAQVNVAQSMGLTDMVLEQRDALLAAVQPRGETKMN